MRSFVTLGLLSLIALMGVSANPVPEEDLAGKKIAIADSDIAGIAKRLAVVEEDLAGRKIAADVHGTIADLSKRVGGPICYCYDHVYHCGPEESPC